MMIRNIMAGALTLLLLCAGGIYCPAWGADLGVIEGCLLEMKPPAETSPASLAIEDYQGQVHRLSVPETASCFIDGIPVPWSDLQPGVEVVASVRGGQLASLEAFSTPHPGYIAPGSLTVKGLVTAINQDEITVLGDNGTEGHYILAPFTSVIRAGLAVPPDSLYTGDQVILYFDDIDSGLISRMEIQGDSILVGNLYRAALQLVNPVQGSLSCSQVELFKNGSWQASASAMSCAYDDLKIYLGGRQVLASNLKYYRGKTVYLLTRRVMGREVVDRLIVKGQTEYTCRGCAEGVNFLTGQFELNQKNFIMDSGTIIIKDGRLQPPGALSDGSSLLVIADNWLGQTRSNIVYILDQGLNNSNLGQQRLYYGRIDLITADSLWLKNPQQLQSHVFADAGDEVQLYYGSDSRIYDSSADKWLDITEIMAGSYAVDEDSEFSDSRDLKDWYGYLYCKQDHIMGMVVWPERSNTDKLRVSTGTVASAAPDVLLGWSINLENGYDWSHHNKQWMPKGVPLKLSLHDALIIKNGQAITPAQLKSGDRLYLLRDDIHIRFAVVK